MNRIEQVEGPSPTAKTVLLMADETEAAILRDALKAYAASHEGPVATICDNLHVRLRWALV